MRLPEHSYFINTILLNSPSMLKNFQFCTSSPELSICRLALQIQVAHAKLPSSLLASQLAEVTQYVASCHPQPIQESPWLAYQTPWQSPNPLSKSCPGQSHKCGHAALLTPLVPTTRRGDTQCHLQGPWWPTHNPTSSVSWHSLWTQSPSPPESA